MGTYAVCPWLRAVPPHAAHAAQDENTRYVCIGPVNKPLNMLCRWLEGDDAGFRQCAPSCGRSMRVCVCARAWTGSASVEDHLQLTLAAGWGATAAGHPQSAHYLRCCSTESPEQCASLAAKFGWL